METLPKNLWKQISSIYPPDGGEKATAKGLFNSYSESGHLSVEHFIDCNIPVIADFFRRISSIRSAESPILRRRDTRWMSELDYSRVNISLTGWNNAPGTFISAAFRLTTLRSKGIIIEPITLGPTENLEILSSHVRIRPKLADKELEKHGFGMELQVGAFCEAAHLLGFVIGWETDYRVDKLAPVVLNRPEFFLWSQNGKQPSDEVGQNRLRELVRKIVATLKQSGQLSNRDACRKAMNQSGLEVMSTSDGSERTALSFNFLESGELREAAIDYWARTFDIWRDKYGFDMLVLKGLNLNGSPDLSIIDRVVNTARKGGVCRCIGVVAEGNPLEIEQFGINGISLVLDRDAQNPANENWFRKLIELDSVLKQVNRGRKLKFSIPLEIDYGNSEEDVARALIKNFVARFLCIGESRRPLLDAIIVNQRSRMIDNISDLYKKILAKGELVHIELDERVVWWIIRSRKEMLIAVVSVENENRLPPGTINIVPTDYWVEAENLPVLEYDFKQNESFLHLGNVGKLETGDIPYGEFRLYCLF